MEDFEDLKSDCSVDSYGLPPMPPLMKSKRKKLDQTSTEHGPSSVQQFSGSNIGEAKPEKASCMRSASLEKRGDTSNIRPEHTSRLIPVSLPPLLNWTRNTIHSGSIFIVSQLSNRHFEQPTKAKGMKQLPVHLLKWKT